MDILATVAPQTQQNTQEHLRELALSELESASQRLALAGRTIEQLRSDALALAVRIDQAREETERARAEGSALREELAVAREQTARDVAELNSTNAALEAHIARLKQQLERPFRLAAKKVLRRGAGTKPATS